MSIDRKALRAKTNKIKWEKQDKNGLPGVRNEYGEKDLTPFNASRLRIKGFVIRY